MAQLIKGIDLSSSIQATVKAETDRLSKHGIRAGLALLLIGEDRSSLMYYQAIQSSAARCGIDIFNHTMPATATLNEILNLIKTLNNDERANGILVFMPLPGTSIRARS